MSVPAYNVSRGVRAEMFPYDMDQGLTNSRIDNEWLDFIAGETNEVLQPASGRFAYYFNAAAENFHPVPYPDLLKIPGPWGDEAEVYPAENQRGFVYPYTRTGYVTPAMRQEKTQGVMQVGQRGYIDGIQEFITRSTGPDSSMRHYWINGTNWVMENVGPYHY